MMRGSPGRRLTILAAASAALAMGQSLPAHAACTTDVECKGARLCEQGRCVDPPPQTTVAPSISPSVATPPSPGPAPEGRIQVGVVFLSTFLGRATIGTSREGPTEDQTPDLDAAHGVGLSLGYNVIAGLSLGVAPQVFWNLNTNNLVYSTNYYKSDSEFDLLARIAYAHEVIPRLAVYAELLPGYSILSYQFSVTNRGSQVFWSDRAKGLVIGLGGGAAYDITRIFFVNLGVGYQLGYQRVVSPTDSAATYHANTQFLRVAAGVGVKL